MKNLLLFPCFYLFFSFFVLFSFYFPSSTYAQYGAEELPYCSDGLPAGTCLGSGVTCYRDFWGCTYPKPNGQYTCHSGAPVKLSNNRCTSCTSGYKPNESYTDCVKIPTPTLSPTPTPTKPTSNSPEPTPVTCSPYADGERSSVGSKGSTCTNDTADNCSKYLRLNWYCGSDGEWHAYGEKYCDLNKCNYKPTNTPVPENGNKPAPTSDPEAPQPTKKPTQAPRSPTSAPGSNTGNPDTETPDDSDSTPSRENACENPGDAVKECNTKCPDGQKGTCGGHTYCVWDPNGNTVSKCQCETEDQTCGDNAQSEEKPSSSDGNTISCKDNPTSPPDGYTWKNSCKSCGNNDDCPQNNSDSKVNPDTSNWCFSGSCLMLVSGGSSEKKSDSSNKKTSQKEKDKKKENNKKKKQKGVNPRDDTGNSRRKPGEKTAEEQAKKDKKAGKNATPTPKPGEPTATPSANLSATPIPTPLPPLSEPRNWADICTVTNETARPMGLRVTWDPVEGAKRYALRIDSDFPSWEGDNVSPGDIVNNNVTTTGFVMQAKPGGHYQWWVHSVNASGVYSDLTQKRFFTCPELPKPNATQSASRNVGAGMFLILPPGTPIPTMIPTATPTLKPSPTPTLKPTATLTPRR